MISAKDIVPTVMAAGSGYLGYLAWAGQSFPGGLSIRWVIAGLLVFGIVACATGGATNNSKNLILTVLAALGGACLILAIIGFIKPTTLLVSLLAGTIVAMWAVTTVRHAVTS